MGENPGMAKGVPNFHGYAKKPLYRFLPYATSPCFLTTPRPLVRALGLSFVVDIAAILLRFLTFTQTSTTK